MGKKRVTTIEQEIPDVDPEELDPIREFPDLELARVVETLQGSDGAIVRVYKQGHTVHDLTLLDEMSPEVFTPIMLGKPPYGGGTFRIHVQERGKMIANKELKVAPSREAREAQFAPPPPAQTEIVGMFGQMMERMDRNFERLLERVSAPPANPISTLDGIAKVAEILKPAGSTPGGLMTDMIAAMGLLERMRKFQDKDLADKIPISDEGDLKPGVLLREALGMFLGAAREQAGREQRALPSPEAQPGAAPAAPSAPAPSAQPTVTVQTPNSDPAANLSEQEKEDAMLFTLQVKQATRAAAAGENPAEYAEDVYPLVPLDVLKTLANDPNWFQYLMRAAPEVAPHRVWFEGVRLELLRIAKEEGEVLTAAPAPATVPPAAPQPGPAGETQ